MWPKSVVVGSVNVHSFKYRPHIALLVEKSALWNWLMSFVLVSEINNSVGSTDELSMYTGNGLDTYARDDIMMPARHASKL